MIRKQEDTISDTGIDRGAVKSLTVQRKRYVGIILFAVVFALYRFIPASENLPQEQLNAVCFLILCLILWITEAIPLGATAILILILPSTMGIAPLRATLAPFSSPIIFFVISTFALSAALTKVPIAKRLLLFMLKSTDSNVNMFLLAVMFATFLISSVMSNIPATAMFIPTCISFLECCDTDDDKKRTGRALMIGLTVAGMIGGIITPAGSSNNLVSLSILESVGGVDLRFLEWILICAPIAFVILPISWLMIIWIFKPAKIDKARVEAYKESLMTLPSPDSKEIIVAAVMVLMIVLWILSTWYPALDTTVIAIVGMVVMFLPGIEIFSWKEFSEEVSWPVVLMIGSVLCVGAVITKCGITERLGNVFFNVTPGAGAGLFIIKVAVFSAIMQCLIPSGPAVIASTTPLVITAANTLGINPAILAVPLCILSSWTIILPLSAVPMVTYSTGYYKITDISRVGVPVLVIVTLVIALWVPFVSKLIL